MSLLDIENLHTWLVNNGRLVRAVDGVTFGLERGKTFALLGESGCGKSMTSLSILRLLPEAGKIVDGAVRLEGRDLLGLPEKGMRDVRGGRIGIIFQEPGLSLNPVLRVRDQIGEVLDRHTGIRGVDRDNRIIELLGQVGIPDPARRVGDYPFQLSGGMKQRVMIAIALAAEPDILIADEPTTALDVTIQAQILDLLRDLQRRLGMSILLITHDLGVVSGMADRVAVMYAGEIIETATRDAFFTHAAHPYSRKLFASLPGMRKRGAMLDVIKGSVPPLSREFRGCRFAERCDFAWELCHEVAPSWSTAQSGSRVRCHLYAENGKAPEIPQEVSEPVMRQLEHAREIRLDVRDLKVHFPIRKGIFKREAGRMAAVDGVSFSIAAGRTLALVGESGCGKTTTGKAILQLIKPTAGSVKYGGLELANLDNRELKRARQGLQIIFQDPYASLNPRMRVREIMEEGMLALDARGRDARIVELLSEVGLGVDAQYRYPHEFSGGQRQRIAIARALGVNPKLLICDEPTSALDVSVQAQILNLLTRLQHDHGLSYLFITHNIAVVEYLAHEIAVMYLGRIVEMGRAEDILSAPAHPYTRALLAAVPTITGARESVRFSGDPPSPLNPPSGCHYHSRCPDRMPQCAEAYPGLSRLNAAHSVHCHLYETCRMQADDAGDVAMDESAVSGQ